LYNYFFYYAYAEVFRILGWWDAQILTLGRMLSAVFAAIGALAQWQLVKSKISSLTHKYLLSGTLFGTLVWHICDAVVGPYYSPRCSGHCTGGHRITLPRQSKWRKSHGDSGVLFLFSMGV